MTFRGPSRRWIGGKPKRRTGGCLLFDSVEDFQNAFGPHAAEITGDIPNYTDTTPVIQISEVKL